MKIPRLIATSLLSAGLMLGGSAVSAGDPERGEKKAGTCAGCHGSGGHSNVPSMFPTIAGMPEEEIIEKLTAYREGDLQNDQMSPQASGLSDQDIRDLAAYFTQQ